MKKRTIILLIFILILTVGIIAIIFAIKERTHYNTNFVNGNTAGNLYNAGLFCESNGTVFFSNPDDNYKLYAMNDDGSHLQKLSDDTVMYINADTHYVYYIRNNDPNVKDFSFFTFNNNSLCRINRDGSNCKILDNEPCIYATLIGNYIYYLHYDSTSATSLYKIGIDGKDKKQVSNTYIFTCSALGKYFYFNDMQKNGCIYQYDTTTDRTMMIYECNSYKPIITSDNNAYYLDVDQNNALVHANLEIGTPRTLTTDSIDIYNVYGSYIYYQKFDKDTPALCMIKNDATEERILAPGNYNCINVTSYYIYFTDFRSKRVFYTPTSNPGELTPFHPGICE